MHRFQVAYGADGVISGLRDRFVANVGAVGASSGWAMSFLTALCFPTGYRIPNMDVRVTAVTTNKGHWNAARGYGKEATTFVMERIVDQVARNSSSTRLRCVAGTCSRRTSSVPHEHRAEHR